MDKAKFVMKKLSPLEFKKAIFFSDADVLSPVMVQPEHLGLRSEFQMLREIYSLQDRLCRIWLSIAVISAGQLSLSSQEPIFVIALSTISLRWATTEEALADFDNFGEQVMGKEIAKGTELQTAQAPSFPLLGSNYLYTGPLRFVEAIFTARVFKGAKPAAARMHEIMDEVEVELMKETDTVSEKDFTKREGPCFLLSADKGVMLYGLAQDFSHLNSDKLDPLGKLESVGSRLIFTPHDKSQQPVDFTEHLMEPALLPAHCVGCGCTDVMACMPSTGPCHWLKVERERGIGVCSQCTEHLPKFEDIIKNDAGSPSAC